MTALTDLIDDIADIKTDIRNALSAKGAPITSSTPFGNYATLISNLPTAESVLEKSLSGSQTFNIESLGAYALNGNQNLTSVSLPNVIYMNENAISNCENLTSVSLPLYQGWILDETSGDIDQWKNGHAYGGLRACGRLTTLNISSMKILPNEFLTGDRSLTTITATNLIGFDGNNFEDIFDWGEQTHDYGYDRLKTLGINFINMKYLANASHLFRKYIEDTDNNITDTITLPNLITMGNTVFYVNDDDLNDPLRNITTLNLPSLKRTFDWDTHLHGNFVTISFPSIVYLGSNSLERCPNLTTINIGPNITDLSSEAFNDCQSVTTVNIDIDPENASQEILERVVWNAPWGLDDSVTINWASSEESE